MKKKMLVVGLDGACWSLIDDWVRQGELPNIKKLKEEGTWGDLESCVPPITSPAWKCYSTGKNPGKLGVFWWENIDMGNKSAISPSSKSYKSKELWDCLNEEGFRTGVIGMPTTYPPKRIDGFMVCGGPDSMDYGYTYPEGLEKELRRELSYENGLPIDISSANSDELNKALRQVDLQFKAGKYLLEKDTLDFLHVTTFELNGAFQHFYYKDDPVKKAWKLVDERIGELMANFEYVLIMSDHGTSPMEKNYFLNVWLREEGYLTLKKSPYDFFTKIGFTRERIKTLLDKLRLKKYLKKFKVARKINAQLPTEEGDFGHHSGEGSLKIIDFKKTRVIGSPQGPLYINKEQLKGRQEYENLRKELIHKLERLKDPETGKKVIDKVYRREEIYQGPYVKYAPDLIAVDSNEYHNRGGILKKHLFEKSEWKGNNSRYGLFLFWGPGIKENFKLEGVRIFDLAPTMLHVFGASIPPDTDGRVLEEIFTENSEFAKRKIKFSSVKNDSKKRIRQAVMRIKKGNISVH